MEPRIQYAKTSDGVNIAYWTPSCDNWRLARTFCSPTSAIRRCAASRTR